MAAKASEKISTRARAAAAWNLPTAAAALMTDKAEGGWLAGLGFCGSSQAAAKAYTFTAAAAAALAFVFLSKGFIKAYF